MTTREALREIADAHPLRFTDSEVYRTCRADMERLLVHAGYSKAKAEAEVDDAIIHGLLTEVAAILRR